MEIRSLVLGRILHEIVVLQIENISVHDGNRILGFVLVDGCRHVPDGLAGFHVGRDVVKNTRIVLMTVEVVIETCHQIQSVPYVLVAAAGLVGNHLRRDIGIRNRSAVGNIDGNLSGSLGQKRSIAAAGGDLRFAEEGFFKTVKTGHNHVLRNFESGALQHVAYVDGHDIVCTDDGIGKYVSF